MGEKPNEQDEQGLGRHPAAIADVDQDGVDERKAAGSGKGEEQQRQARAVAGGVTDPTPADIATGGAGPEPAEATNLNSSRSNIYRQAPPGGGTPEPEEATKLNSSKSNVAREGAGDAGAAEEHIYQHNQSDLE